jgi:hypothetical protein
MVTWEYVKANLQRTHNPKKAFGRRITCYWKTAPFYPGWIQPLALSRTYTTDTNFQQGSLHLLNGKFLEYFPNGQLNNELIYRNGYLVSSKNYSKKGLLWMWLDYECGYDSTFYTCFKHVCDYYGGEEHVREYICTLLDGKLRCYTLGYARNAARRRKPE